MRARILLGMILLVVVVAAGMIIFAWNSTPRLVEISPSGDAENVPTTTSIRLVFSRAMLESSVIDRLKLNPEVPGIFSWDANSLTFTPEQTWPAGTPVSLKLQAGARAASMISFPMGGQSWSFKTSEPMLAYLWPSQGSADIYGLTPTSGAIYRFTKGMGVQDFTVSSNGFRIYFSAENSQGGTNLYELDRSKALSSAEDTYEVKVLLDCGTAQCRNPASSPDEQHLAYEYLRPDQAGGEGPAQIWTLDLNTKQSTPVGRENHETIQPAWSSDGNLIYYDRTASSYEVTAPGAPERILLANQTGQTGDWSPDGQFYLAPEIYYYQAPENTERGTSHLMRYKISDGSSSDISSSIDVEDAEAVYSPDGNEIAFARKFLDAADWTFGRQLWIMNADGSNAHPITSEADFNHYDLAWSRDGKLLAYVRFDETQAYNPPELWMIRADGSNPVQLVIGGFAPVWIP